jgi:diaminopimelate epimerase
MRVPFTKMEGAGNDYVYFDAIRTPFPIERGSQFARGLSDRHFGIGGDGIIVLQKGVSAPLRMFMWNADGSRGAMCGNGLRCLAQLGLDHGHVRERAFQVETDAGPRAVEILATGGVRSDLGEVRCGPAARIAAGGRRIEYVPGDAGNPHAVVFVDDVERTDVATQGLALQARTDVFPTGVNVEFVQVVGPDELRQRTFERGSGETLACGTGAAVAALAARQSGRCSGHTVAVRLRGGTLRVLLGGSSLAIEGPARTVFTGEVDLPV